MPRRSQQQRHDYEGKNPKLSKILGKLLKQAPKDKDIIWDFFMDGNVTDVLLPFPKNGRGLPAKMFQDDNKGLLEEFLRLQVKEEGVISSLEELQNALHHPDEKGPLHLAVEADTRAGELQLVTVGDTLGSGGFREVTEVSLKSESSKIYALKTIKRPHGMPPDGRRQMIDRIGQPGDRYPDDQQRSFENESTELGELRKLPVREQQFTRVRRHHIVQLEATLTDQDSFYLILSPVALCNLEDLLIYHQQPYNGSASDKPGYKRLCTRATEPALVAECLRKAFGCLITSMHFLHEKVGMQHRDIKPRNVLVVEEGQSLKICLCDFATAVRPKSGQTRGYPRVQTLPYTTPERIQARLYGKSLDTKDDMFTLGLVFLEMYLALKKRRVEEVLEQGHPQEGLAGEASQCDIKGCYSETSALDSIPLQMQCVSQSTFRSWLHECHSGDDAIDKATEWIKNLVSTKPTVPRFLEKS